MQLYQMCISLFEKQISIIIYCFAFLCTDQIRCHLFLNNRFIVWKCLLVQQPHQAQKRLSFSIMGCSGQQKEIRTCLRKKVSKLITSHIAGRTSNTMCLINNNQIPSAIDNGLDSFLIIFFNPLIGPACMFFHRLNGIHWRNDLVKLAIDIVVVCQATNCFKVRWKYHLKLFMEFFLHFSRPLTYQSSRTNHQDSFD